MNSNVYSKLIYHLVWSTKNREPFIKKEFRKQLYAFIGDQAKRRNWHLLAIGGISDHLHLLIQKDPKFAIWEVVCKIKSNSSRFMRKNFSENFAWQEGYSVFTIDRFSVARIKKYILKQEEHHKQKEFSFEREMGLMLDRNNIIKLSWSPQRGRN